MPDLLLVTSVTSLNRRRMFRIRSHMVFRVIVPQFSHTLGDLLANNVAEGGSLIISCSACKDWRVLTNEEVAKLIVKFNPLWSPWNRSPKCRTCGRGRTFHAMPGTSGPSRVLRTNFPDDVRDLHYAWWRERNRRLKIGPVDQR